MNSFGGRRHRRISILDLCLLHIRIGVLRPTWISLHLAQKTGRPVNDPETEDSKVDAFLDCRNVVAVPPRLPHRTGTGFRRPPSARGRHHRRAKISSLSPIMLGDYEAALPQTDRALPVLGIGGGLGRPVGHG